MSNVAAEPIEVAQEPGVQELRLDRDYSDIDRLFAQEEWPFTWRDLELSQSQPKATSFVCRMDGQFAGFLSTHNFGHVAYLDNMIIIPEFRKRGVTRRLYSQMMRSLQAKSLRSFVVHTTSHSAPLIEYLGYELGSDYTFLRREPVETYHGEHAGLEEGVVELGQRDLVDLIALDERLFGIRRAHWVNGLLGRADNHFLDIAREILWRPPFV